MPTTITNKIFKDAGILETTLPENKRSNIDLRIGSTRISGCLLHSLSGSQPYRTQYDVALDSTTYTLGAGKAVGEETFSFYEGPFICKNDADTALWKLKNIDTLSERKIRATIATGRGSIQFKGLLTNFDLALTDQLSDGGYYIIITVQAAGEWK